MWKFRDRVITLDDHMYCRQSTFNFTLNDTNKDVHLYIQHWPTSEIIYLTQGWNIFACLLVPCVKIISQILNASDYWRNSFINILWKAELSHLITQEPLNTTIVIKLLYVENFNNFKNVNSKESSHSISQLSIIINVCNFQ